VQFFFILEDRQKYPIYKNVIFARRHLLRNMEGNCDFRNFPELLYSQTPQRTKSNITHCIFCLSGIPADAANFINSIQLDSPCDFDIIRTYFFKIWMEV